MRIVVTACLLLLGGCANYPADLVGEPLEEAISQYGKPVAAVDYEGARAFYFAIGNKQKTIKEQRFKDIINPDMSIPQTNFHSTGCVYTVNALWTSIYSEWTIHGVSESDQCKGGK